MLIIFIAVCCVLCAVYESTNSGFGVPQEDLDWSYVFSTTYVLFGTSIVTGTLAIMFNSLLTYSNERSRMRWRQKHFRDIIIEEQEYTKKNYSWLTFIENYWYENYSSIILLLLFLCWVGLGAWFGITYEKFNIFKAVYFVISAISGCGKSNWMLDVSFFFIV